MINNHDIADTKGKVFCILLYLKDYAELPTQLNGKYLIIVSLTNGKVQSCLKIYRKNRHFNKVFILY